MTPINKVIYTSFESQMKENNNENMFLEFVHNFDGVIPLLYTVMKCFIELACLAIVAPCWLSHDVEIY